MKKIKENKKDLWFKRKLYGFGWVPAKWQGWTVILIWVILFTYFTVRISKDPQKIGKNFLINILLTILLIFICYKKGEKPKWSWGEKSNKK